MKIKKRIFIRIVSFSLAFIIALGGMLIMQYNQKCYLRSQITNEYKRSLTELSTLVSEINFSLKKLFYSSGKSLLSSISSDIYKNSAAAKECLERLPVSLDSAENIYKFLATSGDFSKSVVATYTKQAINKNKSQLKQLIDFSERLDKAISQTAFMLEDENFLAEDVDKLIKKLDGKTQFSSSVEDIGEVAKNIPTLIYDGPFSDHINKKQSSLLKNAKSISLTKAKNLAEFYLNEQNLKYTCDEKSTTESFVFNGENSVCAVTKKGGYCLYLNKQKPTTTAKIEIKAAISKAKAYLKSIFSMDFKQSYYIINENVITINMAYFKNDVIHYPDLVKIGVSLSDGEIVFVEARSFVMNHRNREEKSFLSTKSKHRARAVVSSDLKIISVNKALIQDNALNEKYCYEFICKSQENEDIIIYVNEKTLEEESIFLIIHTAGGTLTR